MREEHVHDCRSAQARAVTLFGFELPLPVLVLGSLTGITYGLLAVGLVLIYRTSRIVNFAHGQMGTFGVAIMGVLASRFHFPYYLALPLALAAGAAAAGATELVVVRRLRNAPRIMSIVATLGAGAFLSTFALAINPSTGNIPSPSGMPTFHVGALQVNQAYSAMLVFGPVAVIGLTLFLRRSRFGLAIRCASANQEAARMAGISANQMSTLAWCLAGSLSALTAILVIPATGFASTTQFGPDLLLRALAAGVLARMYSFPVAFVAGVGIGIGDQLLVYNYPRSPSVANLVIYVVILGGLLLQRGVHSRQEEKGSWASVGSWQPLPRGVARLPEMRLLRWGSGLTALAAALVLPQFMSNAAAVTVCVILAFSTVGLSVGVVTGLAGQLTLGQFAVAAVGAVVSFHVSHHAPFVVAVVYAGLAGGAVSLVIGAPALRLKGLLLSVTTLGFALMAGTWGLTQPWALGEGVVPSNPVATTKAYYFIALGVFLFVCMIAWNTRRLGLGRALRAVRDNEDNARAFTLSARQLKMQAFVLAGVMAGLGGAVYGHLLAGLDAASFQVQGSLDVVVMTIIGGTGTLLGPLLGAVFIIGLPRFLPLDSAALAATSLGSLLLIVYLPGGIAQGLEPLRARYVRWVCSRHPEETAERPSTASVTERGITLASVAPPRQLLRAEGSVLLEARNLRKAFGGVIAVDGVSLAVNRGEIVGLIGPNGAGKTTTFELLSGFTRPDRGTVVFDGTDVSAMSPEQRGRLGLIRSFQDAALFPTLTVGETLQLAFEPNLPTSFFQSIAGISGPEKQRRHSADALLDLMGLGSYRDKQIQDLSTGTRRITELACMVALSPSFLLLDEPSSGVAQRETEALGLLLRRLKEELEQTILIIEHDIPLIMSLADRVIAMNLGQVIANGTPAEVQADPHVIEAYLGASNVALNRSDARGASVTKHAAIPRAASHRRRPVREKT